jgi:signal transduction histidine kinase
MMKIRTKLLATSWSILGVILITGTFSIIQLQNLYESSKEVVLQQIPLQNAVTEIKLNTTTAHLWFEEITNGNEEKSAIKVVWQLLDDSLWYADSIVKGGTRGQDTFYPIHDEAIAGQIAKIKQNIEELIKSAHIQFTTKKTSEQNLLEEQFDWLFSRLIDNANQVQTLLKTKIAANLEQLNQYFNIIEITLVIIYLLGIGIIVGVSYSLIRAIKHQVGGEPADIAYFAEQIATGHFDIQVKTGKVTTGIYAAIQKMVTNLQLMRSEQERQNWLKKGQTQLSEQMSGNQTVCQLAENIIQFLTPYLDAQVGAFYLLSTFPGKKDYLKMVASYAYTWRNSSSYEFQIGEGIVGQVALERKLFVTHKVPPNYMLIQSGLGETTPYALLVVPILYENTLEGVIELAAFSAFTETHLELLKITLPAIAIAINMAQSRTQTQELLEQSQMQAEELQVQQEELQQTNEELQTRTAQLQTQQEELRQMNEQLGERQQELEQERCAIQEKNVELEQVNLVIEAKIEELELISQYKSEFLANISHELRTPLNSLLILSQVLADNKPGNLMAEQLKYAQTIYSASADLLNLINDILDLSKVEAGKMEINLEPVALTQLITVLEDRFSLVAQEKGLKLVIQLADNLPSILYTDEQRLIQILTNLLGNAIKFTTKGQVTLAIHRPAQAIHLSKEDLTPFNSIAIDIIDTGIGIPQEKQQLIFEAFQQVNGTTSRQYGGTGLGLSISRQLVYLLGGEIQLQSEEGRGSIFTVYLPEQLPMRSNLTNSEPLKVTTLHSSPTNLPVVVNKPPPIVEDTQDNLSANNSAFQQLNQLIGKLILLVDDDMRNVFMLAAALEEAGIEILVAHDGNSAIQQLTAQPDIAMVLMDMMILERENCNSIYQIRAQPRFQQLPIIVLTTEAMNVDSSKYLEIGANDYLVKPIDILSLLSLL